MECQSHHESCEEYGSKSDLTSGDKHSPEDDYGRYDEEDNWESDQDSGYQPYHKSDEESGSGSCQSLEAELSQEEEYNSRQECELAYTYEARWYYVQGATYHPLMEPCSRSGSGYTCHATSESESSLSQP